jgi:hypothetical protein
MHRAKYAQNKYKSDGNPLNKRRPDADEKIRRRDRLRRTGKEKNPHQGSKKQYLGRSALNHNSPFTLPNRSKKRKRTTP